MIKLETTYKASGAVLDGRANQMVDNYLELAQRHLADEAVNRVRQQLHQSLKHPTGNYERHIVTDYSVSDYAVTDSGVVYGPWLEGTSSRNSRTRFKGYHTFRLVGQRLDQQAASVIQGETNELMRKLNS